ncbi:MAG: NAD-binding protein [Candidatus Hinthialibacter antarcticus]|nr:NAD-binding protein [Candidatus Hinthialibacter antarcticus]
MPKNSQFISLRPLAFILLAFQWPFVCVYYFLYKRLWSKEGNQRYQDPSHSSLHAFQLSILAVIVIVFGGSVGMYYFGQNGGMYDATKVGKPESLIDSFYLAVITLTSTGYGDIYPVTNAARIYVALFLVVSFITLAWAGANALAFIVEGHLSQAVKLRRMMKKIESLNGHYIICGLGRVGMEIVRSFREHKIEFVVIDRSLELMQASLQVGELYLVGDATEDEILQSGNIERAKGMITCFPSDADNVFTILTAKVLNPNLFVISRGLNENSQDKLIRAGADRVVMPAQLGGGRMAAMALRPAVVEFLDHSMHTLQDGEPLLLEEILVSDSCALNGVSLKESHIKSRSGVNVMGVKDSTGCMSLNPSADYVFKEGDILVGLGFHSQFEKLRSLFKIPQQN